MVGVMGIIRYVGVFCLVNTYFKFNYIVQYFIIIKYRRLKQLIFEKELNQINLYNIM